MTADPFEDAHLSNDAFLGGLAHILQPQKGYRAGIDPVLLAASVPAKPGQSVLELGCGGGVGLVLLGVRVPNLDLSGVELQPNYAELARRNIRQNNLSANIVTSDITALPPTIKNQRFDHVLANPPYFLTETRTHADDTGREIALAGQTPLQDWVNIAAKRLAPGGTATFIQRAERLPDLLSAAHNRLGSLELLPLSPRLGQAARLILLRGRKGGRGAFKCHAPIVLHEGPQHSATGRSFTHQIEAVMRHAQPLEFP